jgi:hypothetical protein
MADESVTVQSSIEPRQAFSISSFREQIGAVARPNLWYCKLFVATSDVAAARGQLDTLTFRCEKAEIPGRTIATLDDTGSGPALKMPYEVNYNDMEITVICSTDMAERDYFEEWMNKIVYPGKNARAGLVNYYSNFAKGNSLELAQLGDQGEALITYVLYDVYPIQISPMNLSWEENNTYQRFNVTLNYRYYRHIL